MVTEDDYVLTLIRIPYGKTERKKHINKKPILIVHALALSSMHWLLNGDQKSLGFRLADEGYDVWLANMRGTTYSRNHRYLNPNIDSDFWEYRL